MGVEFHVHAGPVLVCKYHFNETVTKKISKFNRCGNGHKNKEQGSNFCSKCGAAMLWIEEEKEVRHQEKSVDHIYDMMSEGGFREDVFEECWGGLNREELVEGHDLFAPTGDNFNKYLGRNPRLETREFTLHLRGTPDVAGEVAKCEEFYAKEIKYLRTKYDSVTVEWLIFTTGS